MEENVKTQDSGEISEPLEDTAPAVAAQTEEDPSADFEELIKGKYKDEFSKRVQGIINARFRKDKENEKRERLENERMTVYNSLHSEAERLKEIYPDFVLSSELKNPRFRSIMRSPDVDMRTAYEVVHHDEIFSSAMAGAARVAREKTVQGILSSASRPNETSGDTEGGAKTDVRALSKKERAEFARRAFLGERVTFR